MRIENGEEIAWKKTTAAIRRSAHFLSALQASDGHWPAENAGVLYFTPPFVRKHASAYALIPKLNLQMSIILICSINCRCSVSTLRDISTHFCMLSIAEKSSVTYTTIRYIILLVEINFLHACYY